MSLCLKRKSVRRYEDKPVKDAQIEKMLMSAMQAPSAVNQQPWKFLIIKNRKRLEELSAISKGAWPLKEAPLGILTLIKSDIKRDMMVPQDMAAATQNILLEATNQGLGAVWIGVFPLEDRMQAVKEILDLDDDVRPFSLIAVGHPGEDAHKIDYRYDPKRVQVIE